MAGSINDFKTSFKKDLARPNRFDVSIRVPLTLIQYRNQSRDLVFRCESDSEVNYNFKYSIEKIKSTGLAINTSNFTYEIDKLLLFCKQSRLH